MLTKKIMFCLFLLFVFSLSGFSQDWQDANCDGVIDIIDALVIAQYYVGLRTSLGPCEYEVLPVSNPILQKLVRDKANKPGGILIVDDAIGIEEINFDINDYYTSMDYFVGLDYIDLYGLDMFPDLKTINLNVRRIYSASVLANCKKLESLKITGLENIDDFSIFSKLTSLKEFFISTLKNIISDYGFLKDYKNLTTLGLLYESVDVSDTLRNVPELPQLKKIILCSHANLDLLYKFPNLECLNIISKYIPISAYSVNDLSFLKHIPHLIELNLDRNNVDDFTPLQFVPGLKKLNLISSFYLNDISFLQYVPGLIELNLSKCNVENISFLKNLHSLTKLNLTGIAIKDIEFLSELSLLEELKIPNYDSAGGYSVLFKLPRLKEVCVTPNWKIVDNSVIEELKELVSAGVIVTCSNGIKLEVNSDEK